jgi:hypothetical protein
MGDVSPCIGVHCASAGVGGAPYCEEETPIAGPDLVLLLAYRSNAAEMAIADAMITR